MSHTMDGRDLVAPPGRRPDLSRIPAYIEPPRPPPTRRDRTPWVALLLLLGFLIGGSLLIVYFVYVDRSFFEPPRLAATPDWRPSEEQVFLPPSAPIPSQAVPMPNGFITLPAATVPVHVAPPPAAASRSPRRASPP